MVAKFIKNIYLTYNINLTEKVHINTQVKITVKPLIKMAKVTMKKGRTWIWLLSMKNLQILYQVSDIKIWITVLKY